MQGTFTPKLLNMPGTLGLSRYRGRKTARAAGCLTRRDAFVSASLVSPEVIAAVGSLRGPLSLRRAFPFSRHLCPRRAYLTPDRHPAPS